MRNGNVAECPFARALFDLGAKRGFKPYSVGVDKRYECDWRTQRRTDYSSDPVEGFFGRCIDDREFVESNKPGTIGVRQYVRVLTGRICIVERNDSFLKFNALSQKASSSHPIRLSILTSVIAEPPKFQLATGNK